MQMTVTGRNLKICQRGHYKGEPLRSVNTVLVSHEVTKKYKTVKFLR